MARHMKLVAFALAATAPLAVVASTAPMANAADSLAISVNVTSATLVSDGGPNGECQWRVTADVLVVNLTGQLQQVTAVDMAADWDAAGGTNGHADAVSLADGGLVPGANLDPTTPTSFKGLVVSMTIPCSTTYSQLEVGVIDTTGQRSAGDDPFVDSTTVPFAVAAGGMALAAVVGVGLVTRQRGRRSAQARARA